MKQLSYYYLTLFFLLFTYSCDNDNPPTSARSPIFKSLTLNPSSVKPGDKVKAHVEYEYSGKEIYENTYVLSITEIGNPSNKLTHEWSVIKPTKTEPELEFDAPQNSGLYSVDFKAKHIKYSTGGPNGSPYGSANSVSATLKVIDNE